MSVPTPIPSSASAPRPRHEPLLKIASGGMATVFLGSLQGELGFRQLVAIKRPHPHLLDDRGFREAWLREARLASGIHHANVVDVRDVEVVGDAIQLVMDYIEGASLGELVAARARDSGKLPAAVAVRVVLDACAGLHAAHEACDDDGQPLGLVHRDVSPQNILVGVDGVGRVTDFGIAKCADSVEQATSQGMLKGKAGYMAPEYVRGEPVDRRADVFAIGVVLWEALTGKRLFKGDNDSDSLARVLAAVAPAASEIDATLAPLDAVVARALARDRAARFATTEDLAHALEQAAGPAGLVATHADVGRFVRTVVGERLAERRRVLRDNSRSVPPPPVIEVVSEPTTAPEGRAGASSPAPVSAPPRPRSRAAIGVIAIVVVAFAAVGAFALGRSHAASPIATPGVSSTSAPTPTPTPTLAPTPTPTPTKKPSHPPPHHTPPPNPYPTTP